MSAPTVLPKLNILRFFVVFVFIILIDIAIDATSHQYHEFFLCRKCGREIVELVDINNVPSPQALKIRNETFGHTEEILIQLFKNPHGQKYEVITSSKASVLRASTETSSDTWWPGYNWIILGCPQCRYHIGWEYIPRDKNDPEKQSFFGLVFGNLLYENDAEDLIVLPKSYQS